jgi:hypothetical protein
MPISCDASLLQDFPAETGRIAKKLVKNWWTKHGLPYCMQNIKEENWVSSATLFLWVDKRISLSNYLILASPRLMKIQEAVMATRVSTLPVMAHKRKFLCEGPLLLRQLGMTLRQRRARRRRFPWPMWPLLRKCECSRADLFLNGWCLVQNLSNVLNLL